jgi:hypothetical protein
MHELTEDTVKYRRIPSLLVLIGVTDRLSARMVVTK